MIYYKIEVVKDKIIALRSASVNLDTHHNKIIVINLQATKVIYFWDNVLRRNS